jgi:arylsulfatase A-like enzyme
MTFAPSQFTPTCVSSYVQAYNSSSPKYQPALHKHLRSKGVEFDQHYVTTPVCCPSRTNILLGKYSHNTNMTDVFPPHGKQD